MYEPIEVFGDGVGKITTVYVWNNGKHEKREMRWGMKPVELDGRPLSLLRGEGRTFAKRCLIVANDFFLRPGSGPNKTRRRVEMITDDPFFCFAGTWREATRDWPESFAGITVEAYPDIEPFQERHMAVVKKADWKAWLSGEAAEAQILRPFPIGSFRVSGPPAKKAAAVTDLFA